MKKLADLHIHTFLSDGTFSPEKVVEYAKRAALAAISITDHDSCGGISRAMRAAEALDIEVIAGVELSAELDDQDVHILGYFIDWRDKLFLKRLKEFARVRRERAIEILRRLRKSGIDIPDKELFELTSSGSIGRLHIAQLLVRKGYVHSVSQAFEKYIGTTSPCYVKKFKLSPKEAIDMIKRIGGIPVLAHPKTIHIENRTKEDILRQFIKDGIEGIEVYHSDHRSGDIEELNALAKKYKLVVTGGSDCHGFGKKEILIGKIKIPYELVEKMKQKNG